MADEQLTYSLNDYLKFEGRSERQINTLTSVAAATQAAVGGNNPFIVGGEVYAPNPEEFYLPFESAFGSVVDNEETDLDPKFEKNSYMVASTSKPIILSELLKLFKELGLEENLLLNAKLADLVTNKDLMELFEAVLEEAKARVDYDTAAGFLQRDKQYWTSLTTDQQDEAIRKHIQLHTTEDIGIIELINLALYYSGNYQIKFLRLIIGNLTGRNDTEIIKLLDAKLKEAAPGFSMLKGDIWGEDSPNMSDPASMLLSFHRLINTISADEASELEKQMLFAMRNNNRNVGFWSGDMLKWINQFFPGAIIEWKTGDYPAIRYIWKEAKEGTPCHLILTVLVSVLLPNGKRITFVYYAKYLSLMQADIQHVAKIRSQDPADLRQMEEEYLNALLLPAGDHFRSAFLQELYRYQALNN